MKYLWVAMVVKFRYFPRLKIGFLGIFNPLTFKHKHCTLVILSPRIYIECTSGDRIVKTKDEREKGDKKTPKNNYYTKVTEPTHPCGPFPEKV